MVDHDRLFKELLSTFFAEFLDLFFPEVARYVEPGTTELLDKEIFAGLPDEDGSRFEADLVAKVKFRALDGVTPAPACFLVHVESQSQSRTEFRYRMFRYFAHLHEKSRLPVYPIAVFSFDEPLRPEPDDYQVTFPDRLVLDFRFRTVQLNRLPWRDFLRHENPVAVALMSKMSMEPAERPHVKLECLRLLLTLGVDRSKLRFISAFLDTYLRLTAAEQAAFKKELGALQPSEKETIMELTTSWMEEGLVKGLEQGLRQGRREEAATLVVRQLGKRLGPVAGELVERVRGLDLARLESLGEALLDFQVIADLERWLNDPALAQ